MNKSNSCGDGKAIPTITPTINPFHGSGYGRGDLGPGVKVYRPEALLEGGGVGGQLSKLGYGVCEWAPWPVLVSNWWALWHPSLRGIGVHNQDKTLLGYKPHRRMARLMGVACKMAGMPRSVGEEGDTPVDWLWSRQDGGLVGDIEREGMFASGTLADALLPKSGWLVRQWRVIVGGGLVTRCLFDLGWEDDVPRPASCELQVRKGVDDLADDVGWWDRQSMSLEVVGTDGRGIGAARLRKEIGASELRGTEVFLRVGWNWIALPVCLALEAFGFELWAPAGGMSDRLVVMSPSSEVGRVPVGIVLPCNPGNEDLRTECSIPLSSLTLRGDV